MANDVSYFKIPGDNTQYSFNDADAETDITTLNSNIGPVRVYSAQGGQTVRANTSASSIGRPYGCLILGYRSVAVVSAVNGSSALSSLEPIQIDAPSSTLTLSGGVLTLGSDSNRSYLILCPSSVVLTIQ